MKVCVLMGGKSSEYDVSIVSGTMVARTLVCREHSVMITVVDKKGNWKFSRGFVKEVEEIEKIIDGSLCSSGYPEDALRQMRESSIEVVFPALHGPWGEDGKIQGFLEICSLPYVGSSTAGSAVSNDKLLTKYILRAHALPVPDYTVINEGYVEKHLEYIETPCVIKSPCQGSSFGLAVAKTTDELKKYVKEIIEMEHHVMVEKFIKGRELTCGVLQTGKNEISALSPTEIIPRVSDYFDFKAKYEVGGSDEITPAEVSEEISLQVQQLAIRVHRALGMGHLSRTDFILDENDELHILESNALPGFTGTSLFPQAAAHAGYSFGELIELLLNNAVNDIK
ncbi:MAG: D-alanine--D-alanine ligase [Deltaproteobacteria bacterium]|nr:D-alanine--D-alanine ligase [Deltaproteobacteria bacterium]